MKICLSQLNPTIGAIEANTKKIISEIERARHEKVELIVFPELAITGYFPDDLLLQKGFVEKALHALEHIVKVSQSIGIIVGLPRFSKDSKDKSLLNSAAVISDGVLLGYQDKSLLPTYDIFDERRYFHPAETQKLWRIAGKEIGILICEDIWPFGEEVDERYPFDPLAFFTKHTPDLFVNISASPYSLGKIERRNRVAKTLVEKLSCPVVLCNQVGAQDGILYDGSSIAYNKTGELLAQALSFAESHTIVDLEISRPTSIAREYESGELFLVLTMGLRDYFVKQGHKKALIGLSGGIDSAVVACIAVQALGKEHVMGVLLPSRYTSKESTEDAYTVATNLGINTLELPIEKPFEAYLETLKQLYNGAPFGLTEENLQARIRGTLLMAISNREGYLLLNTSNKSELAMGYTTLYGDACGAVAVIGDLLKSQVFELADWILHHGGAIPLRILQKAPSAELRENQKDSDSLPEYSILDPIVEEYVVHGKSAEEIAKAMGHDITFVEGIIKKIHAAEYKRRQCPFALRVSEKAFSAGRRVPIVHH